MRWYALHLDKFLDRFPPSMEINAAEAWGNDAGEAAKNYISNMHDHYQEIQDGVNIVVVCPQDKPFQLFNVCVHVEIEVSFDKPTVTTFNENVLAEKINNMEAYIPHMHTQEGINHQRERIATYRNYLTNLLKERDL